MLRHFLPLKLSVSLGSWHVREAAKRFPVLEAHSQICQEIGRGTRQVEARNHVAAEVGTAAALGAILGGPGGPGGHEWSWKMTFMFPVKSENQRFTYGQKHGKNGKKLSKSGCHSHMLRSTGGSLHPPLMAERNHTGISKHWSLTCPWRSPNLWHSGFVHHHPSQSHRASQRTSPPAPVRGGKLGFPRTVKSWWFHPAKKLFIMIYHHVIISLFPFIIIHHHSSHWNGNELV